MSEDHMTVEPRKIAENTALILVSRISMALCLPTLSVIAYLFWGYIDVRFEATNAHIATVERTADNAGDDAARANDRLTAVETRQKSDSQSSDRFQHETLKRLDDVQHSIGTLATAVAGLTATLNEMERHRSAR